MAQAYILQVRERRRNTEEHFFQFFCFPVYVHLLSLSVDVLQILPVFDVLTHYPHPESVVHRLIKEIAVKLNNIGMVLRLEQLNCFFLQTRTLCKEGIWLLCTH